MTLQHGPVNSLRGLTVVYPPPSAPIAYVTIPRQVREDVMRELHEQWRRAHEGLANAPRLLVLTGGMTIQFAPDHAEIAGRKT